MLKRVDAGDGDGGGRGKTFSGKEAEKCGFAGAVCFRRSESVSITAQGVHARLTTDQKRAAARW